MVLRQTTWRRPVRRAAAAFAALLLWSVGAAHTVAQAPGQPTTDIDFRSAISRIIAAADHDFTDIAGAKISNEYKTSFRIKYRGSTYAGLITPSAGGSWACTFPVLLTLDKSEADAAFSEWTAALAAAVPGGRLLPTAAAPEANGTSHSNLERVAADAPVSIWGAERGEVRVRLFYTANRDDQSYYLEVVFVHSSASPR